MTINSVETRTQPVLFLDNFGTPNAGISSTRNHIKANKTSSAYRRASLKSPVSPSITKFQPHHQLSELSSPATSETLTTAPSAPLDFALKNAAIVEEVRPKKMVVEPPSDLLAQFVAAHKELESYISGKPIPVTGNSLTLPAVTAVARYGCRVAIDESPAAHKRLQASRKVIDDKLAKNMSIYGVSTGFGGSADTRTDDHTALGYALLQHQHAGVLPVQPNSSFSKSSSSSSVKSSRPTPLPLSAPLASLSMPIPWVRAAMLIRANSLIRGHSAVSFNLIERLCALLHENLTPLVPLRGSISASGDLSPLSYVAGTVIGNPAIRVRVGLPDPKSETQEVEMLSAPEALSRAGLKPLTLLPKEHLGILNGTAFSAALSSLLLTDMTHLALLSQALTAFGTEALRGTTGSFDPFIHDVCRPHPGQVEVAANIRSLHQGSRLVVHEDEEEEKTVEEDRGILRQDRYPLRTAPQWVGPQVEDILRSWGVVTREINFTTDNPLIDGETDTVHYGGNFQAMALTSVLDSSRLSMHHLSYLLFTQLTELINPSMNRGLPPNLAFTDPSLNFAAKGIDIGCASYVAESGWTSGPVGLHVKSAEMHNQAVNSMALVSARATEKVVELNSMVAASYLWALCQAVDIRALTREVKEQGHASLRSLLREYFAIEGSLEKECWAAVEDALDSTSSLDAKPRMEKVAQATITPLSLHLSASSHSAEKLASLPAFLSALSSALYTSISTLQRAYLTGARGPAPASRLLGRTRVLYEFVRVELGIPTHGRENLENFGRTEGSEAFALGVSEETIGGAVSRIYEAIRDGRIQDVVVRMFDA